MQDLVACQCHHPISWISWWVGCQAMMRGSDQISKVISKLNFQVFNMSVLLLTQIWKTKSCIHWGEKEVSSFAFLLFVWQFISVAVHPTPATFTAAPLHAFRYCTLSLDLSCLIWFVSFFSFLKCLLMDSNSHLGLL